MKLDSLRSVLERWTIAKELPVEALPEIRWHWIGHLSLCDLGQGIWPVLSPGLFVCDLREGMYSPCSGYENFMRQSMLACFLGSLWCTVVDWSTKSLTFSKVVVCILVKLRFFFLVTLLSCVFLLELFRENSSEPSSSWSIVKLPDSRNCVFTILSLAFDTLSEHAWEFLVPGV